MIQPITKNNISFKNNASDKAFAKFTKNTTNNIAQETKDEVQVSQENTQQATEKSTLSEKFNKAKIGALNIVKKVNAFTKTSNGIIQGVASGIVTTAAVGVIGKNIKESKGNIAGTLGGILKDGAKAVKNVALFVPSLITKSPLENAKNLTTTPIKFYSKYLGKKNISTAIIATTLGLGALAFKTIQGKVKANQTNADLDHKVNHGHIK